MTTLDAALELAPGPPVAVRPDPRRSGRRRPHGRRRRPPADDRGRPPLARDGPRPAGRGPGGGRSTTTPSIAWPADGWHGYEISNWARPGPREPPQPRRTGSGGRTRRSGPGAHAFDGVTRRWNAARLDGYLGGADPGRWLGAGTAARRLEVLDAATAAAERVILGLRTDRGHAGRGGPRAAARRRFGWALDRGTRRRDRGRPDRPDDPRPPALERALLASSSEPRLRDPAGRRPSIPALAVDTRSRRLLRCRHTVGTLTHRVLTHAGETRWLVALAAPAALWTSAPRRSFGPSSRNTSRPPRRSAARRSSSAIASACPARPSAASSPSSRPPGC